MSQCMLTETDRVEEESFRDGASFKAQFKVRLVRGAEQPGVVEDAHCRGLGLGDVLQPLLTQTVKKI